MPKGIATRTLGLRQEDGTVKTVERNAEFEVSTQRELDRLIKADGAIAVPEPAAPRAPKPATRKASAELAGE